MKGKFGALNPGAKGRSNSRLVNDVLGPLCSRSAKNDRAGWHVNRLTGSGLWMRIAPKTRL